jgi:clan AA aspartic protease (TIGR02281 family)
MLRWAYGYLAMAVVVAIGFAVVQGTHRAERRVVTPAAEHDATSTGSLGTDEAELESESQLEDDSEYQDETDFGDDSEYQDETDPGDGEFQPDGELEYGTPKVDPGEWENGGEWEEEGSLDDESNLEYVVQPSAGGHYMIEAAVNGAPVTFLVDTGASDIVLTMADAERLGFHPATLRFTQRFATANGEVRGAPVVLREIRVGQFSLFNAPASVNEAPLRVSLLGMSFLQQLNGYGVENGKLVLRW